MIFIAYLDFFFPQTIFIPSNLRAADIWTKSSDPFVTLSLSDTEKKVAWLCSLELELIFFSKFSVSSKGASESKLFTSSVQNKTLNPTWNEATQISVSGVEGKILTVLVEDKDLLGKDFLGLLHLSLKDLSSKICSSLFAHFHHVVTRYIFSYPDHTDHNGASSKWYTLCDKKGNADLTNGEIRLEIEHKKQ
jgi:hypothetical protein